jgi:hypothetical protein
MRVLSLILFGFFITSCSGDHPRSSEIEASEGLLVGMWALDSISGQTEWIFEQVHFTNDGKFWRFSEYTKSYVVDNELEWAKDSVFEKDHLAYTIHPVDSDHIVLRKGDVEFFCERHREFDQKRIEQVLAANALKQKFHGTWVLDTADFLPVRIPSWCSVARGGTLTFQHDAVVHLSPQDTSNTNCEGKQYGYSFDLWPTPKLILIEWDMQWYYKIETIDSTTLVLFDEQTQGFPIRMELRRE